MAGSPKPKLTIGNSTFEGFPTSFEVEIGDLKIEIDGYQFKDHAVFHIYLDKDVAAYNDGSEPEKLLPTKHIIIRKNS